MQIDAGHVATFIMGSVGQYLVQTALRRLFPPKKKAPRQLADGTDLFSNGQKTEIMAIMNDFREQILELRRWRSEITQWRQNLDERR